MADAAGIDVDEIGLRIVTDAAELEGEGDALENRKLAIGDVDISGASKDVHAMAGDAFGAGGQHRIGGGSTIAGNQVEGLRTIEILMDGVKEVEQARVDGFDLVGAEVAEEIVDFLQGTRDVLAVFEIDRTDAFAGVKVIHR